MLDAVFKPFLQSIKENTCQSLNLLVGGEDKSYPVQQRLKPLGTWEGHTATVKALTVLPDGSVVSGSADKTLRHWDTATGECLGIWKGHKDCVWALTILPDGSVVSGSWDKTLRRWDSATGQCLGVWKLSITHKYGLSDLTPEAHGLTLEPF